jgi:16S rRNA (adenine1518-N6/adenine1519-N6)-dimethyltransferase
LSWRATPRLGQHFLVKGKTLERIAKAACGEHAGLTVEIGPGRGALTERLLARSDRVAAVELDATLAEYLRERWGISRITSRPPLFRDTSTRLAA